MTNPGNGNGQGPVFAVHFLGTTQVLVKQRFREAVAAGTIKKPTVRQEHIAPITKRAILDKGE